MRGGLATSGNDLTGAIPAQLANLAALVLLDLSADELAGPVPAQLGQLARLGRLDLRDNRLTGPIPADLARLGRLVEPSLVVDAPPAQPPAGGEYAVTGRGAGGEELFSLRFGMPEVVGGDGGSSFVFALPVRAEWEDQLARITLSGAEGTVTVDRESNRPVAIARDPRTGRVRAILRGASAEGLGGGWDRLPSQGPEVMSSRGIPDPEAWRRVGGSPAAGPRDEHPVPPVP